MAMSNNVIYCDVTINPSFMYTCTIVASDCGPRMHKSLLNRFSVELHEVVFSTNGIVYNVIMIDNTIVYLIKVSTLKYFQGSKLPHVHKSMTTIVKTGAE
jgi:hypothetical protein